MRWVIHIGWWLESFTCSLLGIAWQCGDMSEGRNMQWYLVHRCVNRNGGVRMYIDPIDGVYAPDCLSAKCLANARHGTRPNEFLNCMVCTNQYSLERAMELHAATNARIEEFEVFMTLRTTDRTRSESGRSSED
jgi:hypothetical protein